jgi:hypothetical protein
LAAAHPYNASSGYGSTKKNLKCQWPSTCTNAKTIQRVPWRIFYLSSMRAQTLAPPGNRTKMLKSQWPNTFIMSKVTIQRAFENFCLVCRVMHNGFIRVGGLGEVFADIIKRICHCDYHRAGPLRHARVKRVSTECQKRPVNGPSKR